MQAILLDLIAAHDEVAPLFQTVPAEAFDWQPTEGEFTIKQILVHLTHANDFYLMILEEVQISNFGIVHLHTELPGWQRMGATDAEAMQCTTTTALYTCFEQAFWRLLTELEKLTIQEFDHPFMLYEIQPSAVAQTTTLRQRVLKMAADHIREHKEQLVQTLGQWQKVSPSL